jgi:hypothetical protein
MMLSASRAAPDASSFARSRRLVVTGAMLLAACSDSNAPDRPPLTIGEFALERVDGAVLPVLLELTEGPCLLETGSFTLARDTTFLFSVFCASPPIPPELYGGFSMSGLFRQITADSLIFPVPPRPYFAENPFASARIAGNVLTMNTGLDAPLVGTHEWTFRAVP